MATSAEIESVWNMMHVRYPYYQRQIIEQHGRTEAVKQLDLLLSGIWSPILTDVPGDALRAAAIQYIASGNTYFPGPGELRSLTFDLMDMAEGNNRTPYTGWQEVMSQMKAHSVYDTRTPEFSDPIAEAALQSVGGMRAVRFCDERALPVVMAQFVKSYRALQERCRGERRMMPEVKALVGRLSIRNAIESAQIAGPADESELWNG